MKPKPLLLWWGFLEVRKTILDILAMLICGMFGEPIGSSQHFWHNGSLQQKRGYIRRRTACFQEGRFADNALDVHSLLVDLQLRLGHLSIISLAIPLRGCFCSLLLISLNCYRLKRGKRTFPILAVCGRVGLGYEKFECSFLLNNIVRSLRREALLIVEKNVNTARK